MTNLYFSIHLCADVLAVHARTFQSLPAGLKQNKVAQNVFTKLLHCSLASSTMLGKYKPAWTAFGIWLLSYKIQQPLNVDETVIAFYLSYLITTAQNRKTGDYAVKNSLSAIQFYFSLAGKYAPTSSPHIDLLKKSASRILQPNKSRCEPVSAQDVYKVLHKSLTQKCLLRTRMHLTVFLLMFLGLFRFSDVQNILVHRELMRFMYTDSGQLDGVLIFISCSKTDQHWDGSWVAIGATGGNFCPVRLLIKLLDVGKYCRFANNKDVGPLLRAVIHRHRPERYELASISAPFSSPIASLSYSAFRESILELAGGSITKHIGLHSARTGGASTAAEHGIDSRLVCGHGRWQQGTTYADTYIKMMEGNMRKYFDLTRQIWKF